MFSELVGSLADILARALCIAYNGTTFRLTQVIKRTCGRAQSAGAPRRPEIETLASFRKVFSGASTS